MREIGGYIELDTYMGEMLHGDGIRLNCGRNALAYLIKTKNIKRIYMPKFMCDSCNKILYDNGVKVIPSYLCTPISVDINNYKEVLVDLGYIEESELN